MHIQCIGGEPLAVICLAMCEDYSGRVGGVPDLCIWNWETKTCKFIEVKGPGDTLRENQKVSHLLRNIVSVA
jgi:fanconi-associated nuclease 1